MRVGTVASRSLALALIVAAAGCATAARNRPVQVTVGRATRPDLMDKVPRLLDQQGYQIAESQDTGNVIRYVSSWVTRVPFRDEADRGASECRTRMTLEARQQAGETYAVTLRVENMMHRSTMDGEWVSLAPTAMFRGHLSEVSEALKLEIDMGVRTR